MRTRRSVGAEAVERPPALVTQYIEWRDRARSHTDRGQAEPAISDHQGRYALGHLTEHASRAAENRTIIAHVGIYKPRRDCLATGDNLAVRGRTAKVADGDDAISNADIGIEAAGARTVKNAASRIIRSQRRVIWTGPCRSSGNSLFRAA